MKAKKHILSLLSGLLLFMAPVRMCAINSPQIHCIAVDSIGDVTITWTLPTNLDGTFISYKAYSSIIKTGAYSLAATITTSGQTTVTIPNTVINGASTEVYFYMVTDTTGGTSIPSDTIASIFLNVVNPNNGTAILQYNAMHTPNLSTSKGWYKIFREFPQYVWTQVDSVQSLLAIDTITVCSALLNYRVEIEDASGCTSVSNRDGKQFKNLIVPPTPIMDTVSVTSGNGVHIAWNRNPNNDVIEYVVYERKAGAWRAIDTVKGINNTSYFISTANPDSASISFCVAALDSCEHPSLLSNPQNTMFLIQAPDSCLNENLLTWTPYIDLTPGIKKYNVFMSFDGGAYQLIGTTNSSTTSFLQKGISAIGTYSYIVQVVNTGTPAMTASSTGVTYKIALQHTPQFSYLRMATVANSAINEVDCYVDDNANCSVYMLQRSTSAAGPFDSITTVISKTSLVNFKDPTANPNNQSYYYMIITKNECGFNVDTTQVSQTIYLSATGDATGTNTLTWNDYSQWQNGVSSYSIFRSEDTGTFSQIATVPYSAAGTNVYIDNVSSILTGEGEFSYYIVATENPGSYPFIDTSASNTAEAFQDPRLYIPNAFAPEGKNRIFIPVGVFVNVKGYEFSIFDRLGQLVFDTEDPSKGWSGSYGGHIAPEGVYVYHLVYTSSKGEYFDKAGSVMLLK